MRDLVGVRFNRQGDFANLEPPLADIGFIDDHAIRSAHQHILECDLHALIAIFALQTVQVFYQ